MESQQITAALSLEGLGDDARAGIDLAAAAGYAGVAFATNHPQLSPAQLGESARKHLRRTLQSKHLTIAALRAAAPRGGLADAASIDRTVENVRRAIALARDLGVMVVSFNIGTVENASANRAGATSATARETGPLRAMRELAEEADAAGITLAIAGESAVPVETLLREVACERARLNLDGSRLIAAGEDPLKVAEEMAGRIGQFTAEDAVRSGTRVRSAMLGEGQLPLETLLEILTEQDFHGPTVVDARGLPDPVAGARHAAEVLRKLMW